MGDGRGRLGGWSAAILISAGLLGADSPQVARAVQPENPVQDLITYSSKYATVTPLLPGPHDPNITRLAANMLQQTHYLRRPLDAEMAKRFLNRYLEMLDPMHIHFFQSDVRQFEKYLPKLPDVTLNKGETIAGREIFARFLQRVDQRVEFVASLLRENEFQFTGDDRYQPSRKDLSWPEDEAAAKQLWKQSVRYEYLEEVLNKQTSDQVIRKLSARYKRLMRSWGELASDEVLQIYLTALANAYDPHSDYLGKAQLDNFAISMNLSLFGIGALLRDDDGYCKIESLVAGGPAARSKKIKPGDRILAVAQKEAESVDVIGWKLNKVVEIIRGAKGSEVTLTLLPADAGDTAERKSVTLIRDEIKLEDQEAKARLIEVPDAEGKTVRLGVIDLPSFYANFEVGSKKDKGEPRSTTEDVAKLINKLATEKMAGLVLDLRRNGGGSLEEAIRLTGLFIKDGPIVQVRDTSGEINIEYDRDPAVLYDGPLIVLTSRFSASASEILAAALQDYGRALVVGDSNTHGKGTVQTIYELNRFRGRFPPGVNPGALKVTIRKFYRASGSSTQLKGVIPDIVLPSVASHLDVGEGSQTDALPWDTIEPAKFEPLNRVAPYLEELTRRSVARRETDRDFAYVLEDIRTYQKLMADKTVSLNEETRRREKQENEERNKARKAERAARGPSAERFYELALKDAAQEGLPEPGLRKSTEDEELVAKADPEELVDGEEEEDPATPPTDATMDEAKRILRDLIELSATPAPGNSPAIVGQQKSGA